MTEVKPAARRKARRFTLQAVYQWQMAGGEGHDIEMQYRTNNNMKKVDVLYFHELLQGIIAAAPELDELYKPMLDRKAESLDQIERAILRIATYELKERIDVPYRVVINEAIELAKTYGATDSHRYINGVVDKLALELRTAETKGARR